MKIIKIILVLLVVLISIYLTQMYFVGFGSVDISIYEGDGDIRKVGKGKIAKGFQVSFPLLDLTEKQDVEYVVKSLPLIDRNYVFMVEVDRKNNESKIRQDLDGVITLIVETKMGKIVDISKGIDKAIRTSSSEGRDLYYFHGNDYSSIFSLDEIRNTPVTLRFKFLPNKFPTNAVKATGRLVLISGGSI
jgi:hypothetical protein